MPTQRSPRGRRTEHARNVGAFTLLELLVVIAILTTLIGILLPALTAARQTARAGRCLANLRRISTSSLLYLERSAGRFPPFRLKTVDGLPYVNEYNRLKPRWQWFLGMDSGPVIMPPAGLSTR